MGEDNKGKKAVKEGILSKGEYILPVCDLDPIHPGCMNRMKLQSVCYGGLFQFCAKCHVKDFYCQHFKKTKIAVIDDDYN